MRNLAAAAALLISLAACELDMTAYVPLSSVRQAAALAPGRSFVPATLTIAVPNDDCLAHMRTIAALVQGRLSNFRPRACKQEHDDHYVLASADLPLIGVDPGSAGARHDFAAPDGNILAVLVVKNGDRRRLQVGLLLDTAEFDALQSDIARAYERALDPEQIRISLAFTNNGGEVERLETMAVYRGEEPLPERAELDLVSNARVEVRLAEVWMAALFQGRAILPAAILD
jgi:hypothetical protein